MLVRSGKGQWKATKKLRSQKGKMQVHDSAEVGKTVQVQEVVKASNRELYLTRKLLVKNIAWVVDELPQETIKRLAKLSEKMDAAAEAYRVAVTDIKIDMSAEVRRITRK